VHNLLPFKKVFFFFFNIKHENLCLLPEKSCTGAQAGIIIVNPEVAAQEILEDVSIALKACVQESHLLLTQKR
jgi:hypothetical protein